jgi:hypothetical protein
MRNNSPSGYFSCPTDMKKPQTMNPDKMGLSVITGFGRERGKIEQKQKNRRELAVLLLEMPEKSFFEQFSSKFITIVFQKN